MKIFQCQACDQPISFESIACESCERRLGFVAGVQEMSALEPSGDNLWHAYADPGTRLRFCANAAFAACNWMVPVDSAEPYCIACRHNRVVPDLTVEWNLTRWRQIEAAKHRLFYTLMRLGLPLASREQFSDGLAFDFLADPAESHAAGSPVLTGHDSGLITLNIAEADDAERERRRLLFGEFYRTLLGHFRHEIGHYYWDVLVRHDASLATCRAIFGDESHDYGMALQQHYANGPPPHWEETHVSSYATAHPWEDFAETFAHYLHIVDTLETASAFEIQVRPKLRSAADDDDGHVVIDFDPYRAGDFGRLIAAWMPLTYAVNSLNRSMGQPALYPFKLTPAVISKLAFVHERIYAARNAPATEEAGADMLKAVITGLRQRVAAPTT
ncbi:zinc-binding metallopeptidase family protein [Methylobacterium gnaphalii]|uniref:Zinc-ribbon domain-containing protein n=1 Tax=Methylobacterium gnaphalii TaxID=1010610 RepID=A0A512JJZ6_9HYPH|nr:putative zinc-binding metallopeptidase [Methylobacterium gnaphalii]GEP10285.1 hypothetical protein MGN01_21300 [Methylobacterium gnaphalii]GJD68639.1 hypothetical protein MMMDOFMJ_1563 [Methylobacterium gnaphalii]GLS49774.1 hypothetical protein GCM10007885_26240 [Methylobacterium gnaphalii]